MAEPLKEFFDAPRVRRIADEMRAAWPAFPRDAFVADGTRGLAELELLARARHIARALADALPREYPRALGIVLEALGPPLASAEGNGMEAFHHHPHAELVAQRGLAHPELSLDAQREITQRTSCEFAIRPYIEGHPEITMRTLRAWTRDPSEHVRRLVSEGTRPRLPWARRLRALQADPSPALALLESLKDDPSGYVRRSVANHLNDIAKDHPDLAVATCERWLVDASPERAKLVRHALRALVKAGHPGAIRLLGGGGAARIRATATIRPERPRIGETVQVILTLHNESADPARLVLALRIHFVKASGKTSPKTFRLPETSLPGRGVVTLRKTVSLRQHTTRTHHAGTHRVELAVDGVARPVGAFELVDAAYRP